MPDTCAAADSLRADGRPESSTVETLSVVIPAYNAADWLGPTLDHLAAALDVAPLALEQIVVVDDGSSDATADMAGAHPIGARYRVEVVRQPNQGRFAARLAGLRQATGTQVLLLDSRTFLEPMALEAVAVAQRHDPTALVWNGHIVVDVEGQPYARFWDAIARLAWRDYFAAPKPTSYGLADFDRYPKGTTCFLAPRQLLLDACDQFDSYFDDPRNANDDTSLIRWIAGSNRIHLSPEFRATYHGRSSFDAFVRHAYHRGIVFVDGYFRPGTRYFLPLLGFLAATPVGAAVAVRRPTVALAGLAGMPVIAGCAARVMGLGRDDAVVLGALAPVFGVTYGAGIWTGVSMAVRHRVGRVGRADRIERRAGAGSSA